MGARSSGWGYFCGDEGTAFWQGKQAIEVFSKQADLRMEKTAIYEIMRRRLRLERDFDLIAYVHKELKLERDQVARMSMMHHEDAQQGDPHAREAYRQSAYECSSILKSLLKQLPFSLKEELTVSYSGGVFKAGELILEPLRSILQDFRVALKQPVLSPVYGAALYALILDNPEAGYPASVVERLRSQESQGALGSPKVLAS